MEDLPKYLFEHLLEALRRDMRSQEHEALRTTNDARASFYHGVNARFNQEILQYLKPMHTWPTNRTARHSPICICSNDRACRPDSSASLPNKINKLSPHKSACLTRYGRLGFGYLIVAAAVFKMVHSAMGHAT